MVRSLRRRLDEAGHHLFNRIGGGSDVVLRCEQGCRRGEAREPFWSCVLSYLRPRDALAKFDPRENREPARGGQAMIDSSLAPRAPARAAQRTKESFQCHSPRISPLRSL